MNVRRYHPPGVVPLEVWDVLIDERPLYLLPDAQLPIAICQLVEQLQHGRAQRLRAGTTLPKLAIDHVVLGGGGATEQAARALVEVGISVEVHPDPVWIGEAGGRALLRGPGAVMEIGQTSVKYSDEDGRVRLPRPSSVPLESESRALDREMLRSQTLAFFLEAARDRRSPQALVLAMPCEIDDALCVAGCSYPWIDGDPTLICDLLSGLGAVPTLVLNDAELAAVAAQRMQRGGTLVLTLGLGLGGAYLPSERA